MDVDMDMDVHVDEVDEGHGNTDETWTKLTSDMGIRTKTWTKWQGKLV